MVEWRLIQILLLILGKSQTGLADVTKLDTQVEIAQVISGYDA
jgi:hypothetical protein